MPPPVPPKALPHSPADSDADAQDFLQFIAGQEPVDAAAAAWMVRRQDGLTSEEEAELQAWLDADPAHGQALEQLEGVWGRMETLPSEGVEALRAGLGTPLDAPARPAPAEPAPRQRWWPQGLAAWLPVPGPAWAAAALVCVLGLGLGWAWWQQPVFSQSYATLRGQQREVVLPDGSTLWLDTDTQAEVALYRGRREVRLPRGQVQFAVQPDAGKPFQVLAGPLRVTVVGTRFTVRNTGTGLGSEGVRVAVDQGRVRVEPAEAGGPGGGRALLLTSGQSVLADAQGQVGAVDTTPSVGADATAWREGRISFAGTTLAQAVAEFERYGPTGLVLADTRVAALRIHGSFELNHLDAFERALPQVLPVRLRAMADGRTAIVAAPGY